MSHPITTAFNDAYIAGLYESFRRDPASVDESWRQFFRFAQSLTGGAGAPGAPGTDPAFLRKVAGAAGLVQAIRQYGHLDVQLDPMGTPPLSAAELKPEFHGITEADLDEIPGAALGFDDAETAAHAVARLRTLYSSTLGFEFEHIEEEEERDWFRRVIERGEMRRALTPEEKLALLRRLTDVDALERFLGRAYQGYKRFSIEGTDALVPMLEAAIERAAAAGARRVVVGMAHRGRINVLRWVLEVSAESVLEEFEGKPAGSADAIDTGDVKYHLGARTERALPDGGSVEVVLLPNPSHLEFVDPVVVGAARAMQRVPAEEGGEPVRDETAVVPVLVHGDAAFPGEGVVAETFNLSSLRGYRTGGSLHIIANNQIGFTTDPRDGRSTHYASDLAKGFEVPIVHVNADDPESCLAAVWLGLAYRERFRKDFLIDLVGYRRHGHNETDEPAFTQPALYQKIRAHPTPRQVWGERLVGEGLLTAADVQGMDDEVMASLDRVLERVKRGTVEERIATHPVAPVVEPMATGVPAEELIALNERLLTWPADFAPMPKLVRLLERRRGAMGDSGGIDWGHAEALAWSSLLMHGVSVRITGQDAERGTFSHRQAVLHDHEHGTTYTPMQHLPGALGTFEIFNSPLSETAVVAFEYGYSVAASDVLVLWEAQYGDFANVAQPVFDQFVASDRAKWGQDSGVVLLLPHGYEGGGPEHSSARLERFLQLCAENNLRVAAPTTPAQYFHVLRRQALAEDRRPLVLMQPKSLLRLPAAASRLSDLTGGGFRTVLDDPTPSLAPGQVRRVVFCSGKVYYDLSAEDRGAGVALVRIEELYPWPHEAVAAVLDRYPALEEVVWAQEEPKNMGPWTFVAPRLRAAVGNTIPIRYVGRPERASPAEGYASAHAGQQRRIVVEALALPVGAGT